MALTKVPDSLLSTPKRKNLTINGEMRIAQRSISEAASADGYTVIDRFAISNITDQPAVVTVAQAGATSLPFDNAFSVTVTTADTSIAAADNFKIYYKVEGFDARAFMFGTEYAKTITLSFWHRHTTTGTYCVAFRNSALDRSYVAEYTQLVTNEWQRSTITLPGDTTGTWLLNSGIGLEIDFTLTAGTNFHTTADAWTAGNYLSTSNQVNGIGAISNNTRISLVQLEVGDEATDFEHRMYGEDLALCQRYFQRLSGTNIGYGYSQTATDVRGLLPIFTKLRGTPTLTMTNGFTNVRCRGNGGSLTPTAVASFGDDGGGQHVEWTVTGASPNYVYNIYISSGDGINLDAEL